MLAALEIVTGVVTYRLRKLEMANLAGTLSIAIALQLPLVAALYRTLFAFGLNVLVYLNNDYIDVALDLHAADKDADKTRFLAAHLRTALGVQCVLGALLIAIAMLYDRGLLVPLLLGGGICVWYSAQLKRRPFADIPAMMLWGALMPLCGVPLANPLGVSLALQLGLFSGVFEAIQVMRDADQDAAQSVRTTGVALGRTHTLAVARALMLLSSAYMLVCAQPLAALVSAGAPFVRLTPGAEALYWTRVKLVYGASWLALLISVYLQRGSSGLLLAVDAQGWHPSW